MQHGQDVWLRERHRHHGERLTFRLARNELAHQVGADEPGGGDHLPGRGTRGKDVPAGQGLLPQRALRDDAFGHPLQLQVLIGDAGARGDGAGEGDNQGVGAGRVEQRAEACGADECGGERASEEHGASIARGAQAVGESSESLREVHAY